MQAGGYATRLWPLTCDRPKMLLPIGDTTVIDRILSALDADDRISTVYVSTNAAFADKFASHLADSGFAQPQLSVEETVAEDEKFGVVGARGQLLEREEIDDDLLVIAGDNLFGFSIPLAYLGATTSLGLWGLYLAFAAETVIPAALNYYRFRTGKWKAVSRGYRPGQPADD